MAWQPRREIWTRNWSRNNHRIFKLEFISMYKGTLEIFSCIQVYWVFEYMLSMIKMLSTEIWDSNLFKLFNISFLAISMSFYIILARLQLLYIRFCLSVNCLSDLSDFLNINFYVPSNLSKIQFVMLLWMGVQPSIFFRIESIEMLISSIWHVIISFLGTFSCFAKFLTFALLWV
jgi:hypothetical protein